MGRSGELGEHLWGDPGSLVSIYGEVKVLVSIDGDIVTAGRFSYCDSAGARDGVPLQLLCLAAAGRL
jgi:hypothetical protein